MYFIILIISIKHKKKKFVPPHPPPSVLDPTNPQSAVLLYDDEETLRSMGKAYLADGPADNVYVMKHYPPQLLDYEDVLDRLRAQGKWDYCNNEGGRRDVTVTFVLDGKLDNKVV